MKINLLLHSDAIIGDYLNIDPYPKISNDKQSFTAEKIAGAVDNLDTVCEDAEAKEIIALDVLDYFGNTDKMPVLKNWVKKLGHGGILCIGGVDLVEGCMGLAADSLNAQQCSDLLYGPSDFPFGNRRNLSDLETMVNTVRELGLKIIKAKSQNYRWMIEAIRP